MCKGGNSVCLAGTCSEVASPNSKCSRKELVQSVVYDEFGLVNRKWEELTKVIPG